MGRWFGRRGLILIILLTVVLRFYQLGNNSPSLTWDEVAWGYNAYSLGKDLRDEFGKLMPVQYLESFGDFKPPVYAYLDILPIKFFGLNEFAVRFPSALFGTLTVLVTYFLVKRLFHPRGEPRAQHHLGGVETLALMSSFFLAISPWHINLSRAAFEANVATFFLVSGVWLFLAGIQEKRWYLPLSAVSFVLSMYTFNTARIVAPLLILVLTFGFRKQLLLVKKQVLITVIIGSIFVAPLGQFLITPQAKLRFNEVNIFSDTGVIERANQQMANDNNVWWSKIIHNRRLAYGVEYLKHYFDNLSPNFLFIKGDGNPKFSTQDVGQLYLWDLPFLIIGTLFLLRKKEGYWWIIPFWLLVTIVPAATARETPHALRIETTLPTFQIIVAYGVVHFMRFISNIKYQIAKIHIKYLIFTLCFIFLLFNFLYYHHGYYTHYPREYSGEWQYGYKKSIEFIKGVQDEYDEIRVTNKLGRPYMYFLFYTEAHPEELRKTASIHRDSFGFVTVEQFSKYRFSESIGQLKSKTRKILYLDVPSRVPGKVEVLKRFYLLNGKEALTAYRYSL